MNSSTVAERFFSFWYIDRYPSKKSSTFISLTLIFLIFVFLLVLWSFVDHCLEPDNFHFIMNDYGCPCTKSKISKVKSGNANYFPFRRHLENLFRSCHKSILFIAFALVLIAEFHIRILYFYLLFLILSTLQAINDSEEQEDSQLCKQRMIEKTIKC